MVVDWARHCYGSQWRLFRDDLSVTTGGYYWFSPPEALHYPGVHHFGQRDWYDRNHPLVQDLGEDLTHKHFFRTGAFAGEMPASRFTGTMGCIENGELLENAIAPEDLFHGYPLECYVPLAPVQPPPRPEPRDYERASAWDRCTVARLWAHIIEWSYANAAAQIIDTLDDMFGNRAVVSWFPPVRENVGITLAVNPEWACVCFDGTRDFQQLAMQGLYARTGPSDIGIFSTNVFWYNAATFAHNVMRRMGVTDRRPIFLTGHSYGAAVALILAARYRFVDHRREIRYLTFGCPKIGDQRFVDLVKLCSGASLRNSNDLVTTIPPDLDTLFQVAPLFPQVLRWAYEDWQRPPTAITQDDDGRVIPGGDFEIDAATLFDIIVRAVNDQPFGRVIGHGMSEYIRRIELRCPGVHWPIDEVVDDDLEATVATGNFVLSSSTRSTPAGLGMSAVFAPLSQALELPKRALQFQILDAAGGFAWTGPASCSLVYAFLLGGGGRGGNSASFGDGGGGGGGGGGYVLATVPVTPGSTYVGNVGDGGSASSTARRSEFAGDGGALAIALAGDNGADGVSGGAGGNGHGTSITAPAVALITHTGGDGGDGDPVIGTGCGAGGGSSAGYYADGRNGEDGSVGAAMGGIAPEGGGDGGDGDDGSGASGIPGHPPGGGAGGNADGEIPIPPGGNGKVILAWFGSPPLPPPDPILMEDGSYMLMEDGTVMIME